MMTYNETAERELTLEEKLELALFPVIREKINRKRKYTGYDLLINGNTEEVISTVTSKYELLRNSDLYGHLKKYEGLHITEVLNFVDRRFFFTFRVDGEPVTIGNEVLYPTLRVGNSYDRTMGVSFMSGHFRIICNNGAYIGNADKTFYIKHITKDFQDKVFKAIDTTLAQSKAIIKVQYEEYIKIEVTEEHVVKVLKKMPTQYFTDLVAYTDKFGMPPNGWELLNMISYVLTHDANRDKEATILLENSLTSYVNDLLGITNAKFNKMVQDRLES